MTDVVDTPVVDEPTDDDSKGTPIVPAEVSEWGNDITFTEPNTKTETGDDVKRDNEDVTDEPVVAGDEPVVDVPTAPLVPTAPVTTVTDPGEFKPQDYSFDVTIDGKTTKVATVEEADAIAANPDNFETPAQLMDFIRKSNKMENGIEKDKAAWDQAKQSFDQQQQAETDRREQIDTIAAEINYLQQRGDLPPVNETYTNADWKDPLVAKQPGVREQLALLTYMGEENDRRAKAGLKSRISVLDAFNGWQIEQAKNKAATDKKTAGEQRKNAGSKVAGQQAAPVTTRPTGIKVGRVGNLNDLSAGWN